MLLESNQTKNTHNSNELLIKTVKVAPLPVMMIMLPQNITNTPKTKKR